MTRRQQQAVERMARQAERSAEAMTRAYDRMRATFPEYNARDDGAIMAAARVTDDARRGARNLRQIADRIAAEAAP